MSTPDTNVTPETEGPTSPAPKRSRRKPGFQKGDPNINRSIPGPGRTAGYKHYIATLTAGLIDGPTSDRNSKPFMVSAIEKWKKMVIAGDRSAMRAFSEATFLNPDLMDKIDGVLNGQKTSDIKWMRYQLFDRSFDKQQSVLLTKQPTSILVCGRRAGKTEVLATKIVQVAIAGEKGEDVIYIGKTYTSAYEIIWQRIVDLLNEINVPFTALLSEQTITLASGVNIYVRGAHTVPDIDKLRGHKYKLTVIDEIQSIKHLRMLINEILRSDLNNN